MLEDAEREAEEMLEAARATGRGIVAEAEREALAMRRKAEAQRDQARVLLRDAKQLVARARSKRAPTPPNGHALPGRPIDLNEATAEDLRLLGLSTTQARRVIARRERDGAYTAVDQLGELPGMPAPLLAQVRSRLKV